MYDFDWSSIVPSMPYLLAGLVIRLLFRLLRDGGTESLPAMGICLLFGGVLYLAALQAQGLSPVKAFRLR